LFSRAGGAGSLDGAVAAEKVVELKINPKVSTMSIWRSKW